MNFPNFGNFGKWQTPEKVRMFQLIFIIFLVIALYFIQTTIPTENAAGVFIGVFIMAVALQFLVKFEPLGWGESVNYGLKALIYGGALVLGVNLWTGFSATFIRIGVPVQIQFSLAGIFSIFYVAITAAFIEEFVFRERLTSLFYKYSNNMIIAVILQAIVFGLFHLASYTPFAVSQGIPIENLLYQAGIFGLFAGLGNIIFKSTAFGLGMHLVNNILTFTR